MIVNPHSSPNAVGRRRRTDDRAGRERLLDVAIELFSERGIANTTISQIASAGEVTSAMVHYWFDTREKLYDAIVEERLVPLMQAIWEPAELERESAVELVRGLLRRMLDVTAEAPWLPSLWLREIVQAGGLLRDRVLSRVPLQRNIEFQLKIEEAQARGEINPGIAPDLLFLSMLAMVMLPQATAGIWQKTAPSSRLGRSDIETHVTTLLLEGMLGAPSTDRSRRKR